MNEERKRTYKCLAHSKPRPVLDPVITTVFPSKLVLGSVGVSKSWPRKYWRMSEAAGMVVAEVGR